MQIPGDAVTVGDESVPTDVQARIRAEVPRVATQALDTGCKETDEVLRSKGVFTLGADVVIFLDCNFTFDAVSDFLTPSVISAH